MQQPSARLTKQNSPCVRNCCLNDEDVCLGCFRSLPEITEWAQASANRQQAILGNCLERKTRYRQKYPGFNVTRSDD